MVVIAYTSLNQYQTSLINRDASLSTVNAVTYPKTGVELFLCKNICFDIWLAPWGKERSLALISFSSNGVATFYKGFHGIS